MVAVVSGNSLGLSLSSWTTLGQRGLFGGAVQGRAGETAIVNVSNGNLVLQDRDDRWSGHGLSADALRTYNSQGLLNDDNFDNWSSGFYRNQLTVNGSVNTASSTIVRTNRDGAQALFQYDGSDRYLSTNGGGAYQAISFDAANNQYVWVDSSNGLVERYAASGGRLLQTEDAHGNKLIYNYNGAGQVASITDPNGETHTYFDYGGLLLTQIRTVGTNGQDFVRVRYGYDGSNRLESVAVDLTPDDGSIADNNVYLTTYTYDGASNRVKTVTQSDGTSLTFHYVYAGGSWRVSDVTDALGQGTHFDYDLAALKTTVTDALHHQTVFQYDAAGQLCSVTAPSANDTNSVTRFEYNANGDLILVTDAMNRWTRMGYDGSGNLILQEDSGGVTIDRTYNSLNRLLTETIIGGGGETHASATSRYVYDDADHARLRFVISAEGRVTEYQYNSRGEKSAQLQFADGLYPLGELATTDVPTEAQLIAWCGNLGVTYDAAADFSATSNPAGAWSYGYSPKGGTDFAMALLDHFVGWGWNRAGYSTLGTPSAWKNTSASTQHGVGPGQVALHPGPTSYGDYAILRFTAPDDGQYTIDGQFFAGDQGGMSGFIVLNGDFDHPLQSFNETTDASLFSVAPVRLAKGQTLDFVVGNRGSFYFGNTPISVSVKRVSMNVQRQDFGYDAQGRLQTSTVYTSTNDAGEGVVDAGMALTHYVYDPVGRLVSSFNARNFETQYTYDGLGRVLTSRNVALNETTVTSYDDANNATTVTLANGLVTTSTSDKAGRLIMTRQQDASHAGIGDVRNYFDANGQLRMTVDQIGTQHWHLYDEAGRRVADVDAAGALTEYRYNADNLLTYSVKYANNIDTSMLVDVDGNPADVSLDEIRATDSDQDLQIWQAWDEGNRLAGTATSSRRSGGASVATFSYDSASRVTESRRYSKTIDPTALGKQPNLADIVPEPSDKDRVERSFYDSDGRLIGTLDAAGGVKEFRYDGVGRLVGGVQYLNLAESRQGGLSVIRPAPTPGDITTRNFYNARGQLVAQLDGDGNFTETQYDTAGNVTRTLRYRTKPTGPVGATVDRARPALPEVVSEYTYDAIDRVLTQAIDPEGLNLVTRYAYDDVNNRLDVTNAAQVVTRTTFDVKGQVLDVIVDAAGLKLKTARTYDDAGHVLTVTDPAGVLTKYTYDGAGHLYLKEVDPFGLDLSTYYSYDAFGNLAWFTDANDVDTEYHYDGLGRLESVTDGEGGITTNHYDAFGQLSYSIRTEQSPAVAETAGGFSDPISRISYFWYDGDGRLTVTMNALGEASRNRYDAAGRLIETIRYSKAVTPPLLPPSTASDMAPPVLVTDADNDRITRLVYDAMNRPRFTIDATGAVAETRYDYAGRVSSTVQYAGRIDINKLSDATQPSDLLIGKPGVPALITSGAGDRQTQFAYDNAGRLIYSGDATGGVVHNRYDLQGNVVETIRYGRRYSGHFDTLSLDAFYADIANQTAMDRHSRVVHDAAGRAVFTIDALGGVVRSVHDSARLVRLVAYPSPIDPTVVSDATTPADMLELVPVSTLYAREVIYTYDEVGRRVHTAVSQGVTGEHKLFAISENVYDKLGHLKSVTAFAALLALEDLTGVVSRATMEERLDARATPTIDDDRTTLYGYDNVGRLTSVIDPDGYTQIYGYNKLGDRISYIDQKNNQYDYSYDRAGRLRSELSPEVQFFTLDRDLQAHVVDARIETRYGYNAFGELNAKIEAYGRPEQRVTRYFYDSVGRQVLTTFDEVGTYDANLDDLSVNGGGAVLSGAMDATGPGVVKRTESLGKALSEVSYNVFGEAIANRDAAGNFSYKTYDKLGRLVNQVDANGNVLNHYYAETVGEFSGLTQLDGKATVAGGLDAQEDAISAAVALMASTGTPRSMVTYYDKLGRTAVQSDKFSRPDFSGAAFSYDAASSTAAAYRSEIDYQYDVFGNLIQRTELLDGASGRTAKTRFGYDLAGNLLRQVDAQGYVTDHERDAFGQDRAVTQYATALSSTDPFWTSPSAVAVTAGLNAAGGADRTVSYEYDRRGYKTEEALDVEVGDNHYDGSGFGSLTARVTHVVRQFKTDGTGNLVRSTNGNDLSITVSQYDALGRLRGTNTNGRSVYFHNNVFGQQVQIIQSDIISDGVTDVVTSHLNDSIATTQVFDRLGRVIQRRNANGADTFMSYDLLGRLVKEWTPFTDVDGYARNAVKVYTYDKVGRLTETRTLVQRTASDALTYTADTVQYNNFGEVANRLRDGAIYETNHYDVGGRLVKSNAGDGVYRVNWYDLQGNLTSRFVSGGTLDLAAPTVAPEDLGSQPILANVRRTTHVYDMLGHMLKETGPLVTHLDGSTTSLVTEQQYDAWGNVVSVSRNSTQRITYRYTTLNQLARASDLGVSSTAEDGSQGIAPLVRSTYYDAAGRKTADIDARGNATLYGYREETGDLMLEGRADGTQTSHSYDSFGREATRHNSSGSLHAYEFDHLGHLKKETVTGSVLQHDDPLSADFASFSYTTGVFVVGEYAYDELGNRIAQVSGEGDTRNAVVRHYSYDTASRLVCSAIVGTSGTVNYSYDGAGRKILETDALGQQARWFYRADGRLSTKVDIGGGTTTFDYDEAGQLHRQSSDRGQDLQYTYDAAGRVSTVSDLWNDSLAEADYDADGNRCVDRFRIRSSTAAPLVLRDVSMVYDGLGRVTHIADGTTYVYDIQYDANGNRLRVSGSYKDQDRKPEVVQGDALFRDPDGLSTRQVELSFTYDEANRVRTQRSLVELNATSPLLYTDMSYGYDSDGHRTREAQLVAAADGASTRSGRQVEYRYDALGRLTETFVRDETVTGGVTSFGAQHAHRKVIYDAAQGRTQEWQWVAGLPAESLSYNPGASGPDRIVKTETEYDERGLVHRFTRSEATLYAGPSEPGPAPSPGPSPAPPKVPHVPPHPPELVVAPIIFPEEPRNPGDPPLDPTFHPVDLLQADSFAGASEGGFGEPWTSIDGDSARTRANTQAASYSTGSAGGASAPLSLVTGTWYIKSTQANTYDDHGNLVSSIVNSYRKDSNALDSLMSYTYGYVQLDGYRQYRATVTGQQYNGSSYVVLGAATTSSDYDVNGLLIGSSDTDGSNTRNERILVNDNHGHIVVSITGRTAVLSGPLLHSVLYEPDGNSHTDIGVTSSPTRALLPSALTHLDGAFAQRLFYANGMSLGSSTENQHKVKLHTVDGAFLYPWYDISSDFSAGFGVSQVQGVQGGLDAGGASQNYTWREGDTLRGLAQTVYGDANLWWVIADANGVTLDSPPDAGIVIRLPSVTRSSNGANAYAVYNPSNIVGDTNPEAIAPPPFAGVGTSNCGMLGEFVVTVIVVAVAYYISEQAAVALADSFPSIFAAPAAASGGGGAAGATTVTATTPNAAALAVGGAIGGATGSAVGQGLSIALGLQQDFSWKQVGLAAIGGAVGGALKGANVLPDSAALRAALGNTLTQGLAIATGLQQHFDWRSVVASAVSAPVGEMVAKNLGPEIEKLLGKGFEAEVGTRLLSGVATQFVRQSVYRKGHLDFAQIAADAFGNAIGESIASQSTQGQGPWSDKNYRNGSDIESDNFNPASAYGYRNGSDVESDAFRPAMAYGYRNGSDVESDNLMAARELANNRTKLNAAERAALPEAYMSIEQLPRVTVSGVSQAMLENRSETQRLLHRSSIAQASNFLDRLFANSSTPSAFARPAAGSVDWWVSMGGRGVPSDPRIRTMTAIDTVAERARAAGEQKAATDLGMSLSLPFNTLSATARTAGMPDRQVNQMLEAEYALTASLAAPLVGAGSVSLQPVARANPLRPVLEHDLLGNEVHYRTMSEAQYQHFRLTGELPPTTETSISPLRSYSEGYRGVTVQITTRPSTSEQLQQIGIAANEAAAAQLPGVPMQSGPWMQTNARFKVEGGQMTTQLGQGEALDIYNRSIVGFKEVSRRP